MDDKVVRRSFLHMDDKRPMNSGGGGGDTGIYIHTSK